MSIADQSASSIRAVEGWKQSRICPGSRAAWIFLARMPSPDSQLRESALSSGIPLAQKIPVEERACGVWIVDTRNGQTVAFLRFQSGVREIFAVQILPGMRWPEILTEESPVVAESFLLPDAAMGDVKG
jgi:hypothetical protein